MYKFKPLKNEIVEFDFNTGFATALAWFGQMLRGEENWVKDSNFSQIAEMAKKFVGPDKLGLRQEATKLMNYASLIQ